MTAVSTVLRVTDTQFQNAIDQLGKFVAIPSVSHPTSPYYKMENLEAAANFTAGWLKNLDFTVTTPRIDNCAPFVIAERIVDKLKPTILIYAHYDVQPVDEEKWTSKKPFVMEKRDERLYGRGASDDKGGIIAILTVLQTYKDAKLELPVNVIVFFEGEEEFGSSHMAALVKQEAKRLQAHALVVLDGMNRDVRTGTLTSSTRGILNINIRVDALRQSVHSGIGVILPDPAKALVDLLHSVRDPEKIPGFMDGCDQIQPDEREILRNGSISEETYKEDNGVVQGARLRGNPQESVYERIVNAPNLTILNMNSGQPRGGNSVQASAEATISIRILPGHNPERIGEIVMKYLSSQAVRYNLPVKIEAPEQGAWAWKAKMGGFSKAYLDAMKENFEESCAMPCGGALPLLRELGQAFPHMEMIVPAVEDPATNAHSHDESQHIGVFRNAINSLISFLGKAGKIKVNQ